MKKYRYKLYFNANVAFSNSFNFFESSRIVLINMVILMMPAKTATLGLLKIKLFWNDFDVMSVTSTQIFSYVYKSFKEKLVREGGGRGAFCLFVPIHPSWIGLRFFECRFFSFITLNPSDRTTTMDKIFEYLKIYI